eukprot:3403986-Prymnesium_polylepis.2
MSVKATRSAAWLEFALCARVDAVYVLLVGTQTCLGGELLSGLLFSCPLKREEQPDLPGMVPPPRSLQRQGRGLSILLQPTRETRAGQLVFASVRQRLRWFGSHDTTVLFDRRGHRVGRHRGGGRAEGGVRHRCGCF